MNLADAQTALFGPDGATGRVGAALAKAGFATTGSPAPALLDPVSEALAFCGVNLSNPAAPSDADVGNLANADWGKFLDVAAAQAAYTALPALALKLANMRQWEDYREQSSAQGVIDGLKLFLDLARRRWGFGAGTLTTSTLDLGTQTQCQPEF